MISAICVIGARLFGFTELLNTEGSWLYLIKGMGGGLLGTLMVPVLAAYMAYSIADKPALAAGFAAGLCANTVNGGFLVGMLGGILAGYTMRYLKKWIPSKGTFAGFISFVVWIIHFTFDKCSIFGFFTDAIFLFDDVIHRLDQIWFY